jgi:O-antigen ligase
MTKSQKNFKSKPGVKHVKNAEKSSFFSDLLIPANLMFYFFIFSLVVVLPLVYSTKVLDPALHVRLLALAAFLLIFTLLTHLYRKEGKIDFSFLQNKIIWFLAAYFIITLISAFFAHNYKESIFDINKTFAILALVIIAVLVFKNVQDWPEKLSYFVLITAVIAVSIGFYQYDERVINATTDKAPDGDELIYLVKGLMAHKNMYSSSLMLMLPFLGFGIFRQKGMLRFTFIVVTLAVLTMILLLSTRSVWLGIILAVLGSVTVLVAIGSEFNLGKRLRQWALILSVVVLAVGITVVFTQEGNDNYSVIERIKSITQPGSSNNPYRLKIWDISLSMAQEYPLTGVGAGNWKIESPKYFQGYGFKKDQLNWVRPHNDYLWAFSEKGVIGLIVFLGIFFMLFWYIARIWKSELPLDRKIFSLLIFGGIIGYMTDSAFSFPLERIDQQVYFGLMSASVVALHQQTVHNKEIRINPMAGIVVGVLAFSFTIIYCISEIKMEVMVRKAREYHVKQDWKSLLDLSVNIPTTFRNIDPEVMPVKWYQALALGSLERLEEARDVYLEAVKANPTRVNVLNNLGRIYFQLNDFNNAKKYFEMALNILPDYFESTVNMASTLYQLKEYEKSLEYWEKIPENKRNEPIRNNFEMVKRKMNIQ